MFALLARFVLIPVASGLMALGAKDVMDDNIVPLFRKPVYSERDNGSIVDFSGPPASLIYMGLGAAMLFFVRKNFR